MDALMSSIIEVVVGVLGASLAWVVGLVAWRYKAGYLRKHDVSSAQIEKDLSEGRKLNAEAALIDKKREVLEGKLMDAIGMKKENAKLRQVASELMEIARLQAALGDEISYLQAVVGAYYAGRYAMVAGGQRPERLETVDQSVVVEAARMTFVKFTERVAGFKGGAEKRIDKERDIEILAHHLGVSISEIRKSAERAWEEAAEEAARRLK